MTLQHSVTKLSFVRGIGHSLQQHGAVQFASPADLRYACDKVAHVLPNEPIDLMDDGTFAFSDPTAQSVQKVAQSLIAISDGLRQQGKTAAHPQSVSLLSADAAYGDLIRKVAAESMVGTGGEGKNDLANAAAITAEGKLEAQKRPEGYAVVGQGNTNFSEGQASRIGTEQPHPDQDISTGAATNSVVQATKAGSISDILSKLGMPMLGATITGSDPEQQNTPENATTAEAVMDAMERPSGYANVGQGNTNIRENVESHVGTEQPHPKQPTDVTGATTNSVIEASKGASYKHMANVLMPALPPSMTSEQKLAAVQYCADLDPSLREFYVRDLLG